MNIDDKKLDELLRNVSVPDDLKTQLKKIPVDSESTELSATVASRGLSRSKLTTVLALAASLLLIASIPLLINLNRNSGVADNDDAADVTHDRDDSNDGGPAQTDTAQTDTAQTDTAQTDKVLPDRALDELAKETALLKQQIQQIKLAQMRSRLSDLEATQPIDSFSVNMESIIESVAGQTPLYVSGDVESVRQNMARIVERYPNTPGADLAQSFLAEH